MQITSFNGTNIKGQTFNHSIGPAVGIIGRNFTGKSSRLDAIRLWLFGSIPELGKRNPDTFVLSSGEHMVCGGEIDGKPSYRQWDRKKDSISCKLHHGENLPDLPDVMLSAEAFFSLSLEKRLQYVFDRVQIDLEDKRNALIAAIKNAKSDPHTEDHENQLQEILSDIPSLQCNGLQEWVVAVQNLIDYRLKLANQNVERLQKSIEAAEQSQGAVISLKDAEKASKESSDQITAHKEKIAQIEREIAGIESLVEQKKKLTTKLVSTIVVPKAIQEAKDCIAKLELEISGYRSKTGDYENDVKFAEKRHDADRAEFIESGGDKIEGELNVTKTSLAAAKASLAKVNDSGIAIKIRAIESQIEQLKKESEAAEQKWKSIPESEACDKCGSSLKMAASRDLENACSRLTLAIRDKEAAHTRLAEITRLTGEVETLDEKVRSLTAKSEKIPVLKARVEKSRKAVVEAREMFTASTSLDLEHAERKAQLASLRGELTKMESDADAAKVIEEQIAAINIPDRQSLDAALELAKQRLNEAQEKHKDADLNYKKAIGQQSIRNQTAKQQDELAKVNITSETLSIVREAVRAFRDAMIAEAFKPILDKANKLAGPLLKSPIGWADGNIVLGHGASSHKAFSGTEQAVVFAALQVALATTSPFKLVWIDEIGRLDQENRKAFVRLMIDLQESGEIDQFIFVDNQNLYADMEVQIIET